MNNRTALTGAVLLEAYWASRKKDMLDLIAPFVNFGIAKTTSTGEIINISTIDWTGNKICRIISPYTACNDFP